MKKKLKIKKKVAPKKEVEKQVFPPARFPTQEEIIQRVDERNSKPVMRQFNSETDMERLIQTRFRDGRMTILNVFKEDGREKAIERAKLLGQTGGTAGGGYSVMGRPHGIIVDLIDREKNQIVYCGCIEYSEIVDYLTEGIESKCAPKEKSKSKLKVKKKPKLKIKRVKK